ncbi:NAD-P-binding protein [Fomitopsis serialis]|uniref:NAD-P-binding protein n=1 Tax=Fomitopsis serialis TaxID=139415 RepID=UPI0020080D08|nr:NAD-P-binding protein [Neoantrodia serialis]KAH9925489.1 NAD-P-binding protein [Neoantrodia serialis]
MPSYAVVGASRGIGLELVRQLALEPDNTVFATARNKQTSTHLHAVLQALPHKNVHVLGADVTDHRTLQNAAAEAAEVANGSLDVLIYNAAILDRESVLRSLLDYPSEDKLHDDFIQSYEVNVLGAIHAVNAFLPLLRKGTTKKIILVGGGASTREFVLKAQVATMAALSITKAALTMVVLKYAVGLKDEGFTVVSVNPGWVDTSATAETSAAASAEDMAKFGRLLAKVKAVYPQVQVQTPEAAVRQFLATVSSVGPADTGAYLSGPGFGDETA